RSVPVGTTTWSVHRSMALYLRRVIHPQAHDNYRVILKPDEGECEIGSIGIQYGRVRSWGIDTVIPMHALETQGERQEPQRLHATVQRRLGPPRRRRGQPR
ncbi:MAG TPA: hypothetical protein VKB76_01855, partial [Ktedonobacterales bacterium]|nr:hypothetical protein [Ktedonobacterales bacterium]